MTRISAVSFGTPHGELPKPAKNTRTYPKHWVKVAQHCLSNPGVWHPVRIGHLTRDGHKSAARYINGHHYATFADPGFSAAYRDGELYVRYITTAAAGRSLKAVGE